MIKLILKRIWIQRKSNTWLLINIFIISILMVSLVDSFSQMSSYYDGPKGFTYDAENTYIVACAKKYNEDENVDKESILKSFNNIYNSISKNVGVDKVSIFYKNYDGAPVINNKELRFIYHAECIHTDANFFEIFKPNSLTNLNIDNDFFKDSWIKNGDITPIIISSSLADHNFFIDTVENKSPKLKKDKNYNKLVGTIYETGGGNKPLNKFKIVAVSEPTKYTISGSRFSVYTPGLDINESVIGNQTTQIVIKSKSGVALTKEFLKLKDNDHFQVSKVELYTDWVGRENTESGNYGIIFNFLLVAIFFVFNLVFGIFGSFWYRTIHRKSEIGLQMAIGAAQITI